MKSLRRRSPPVDRGGVVGSEPGGELFAGRGRRRGGGSAENFVAGGIVHGEAQVKHGTMSGGGFRRFDGLGEAGRKTVAAAQYGNASPVLGRTPGDFAQVGLKNLHQVSDFGRGALPILNGKGEEGQGGDAKARGRIDNAADDFQPHPVALRAGPAAAEGPAAVAVGDEGDVEG
jgi:hypothetical protein